MILLAIWDRGRRTRKGLVNKPISILIIKVSAVVVLGGIAVAIMNQNRSQGIIPIAGVPIVVPITVAILFIGTFVLDRTRFGRHLYAVGGNPEAARRAGIKVAKIRIYAFIICAFLAVVSGIFHSSRIGNVDGSAGHTIVLNGVAAAVVGGVSLFGGRGKLSHAAIGALVITMIDNGLGLLQMPAGISFLITGSVLSESQNKHEIHQWFLAHERGLFCNLCTSSPPRQNCFQPGWLGRLTSCASCYQAHKPPR
jgi:D-xylose transport system permease protein